jgi:hypothetical protein
LRYQLVCGQSFISERSDARRNCIALRDGFILSELTGLIGNYDSPPHQRWAVVVAYSCGAPPHTHLVRGGSLMLSPKVAVLLRIPTSSEVGLWCCRLQTLSRRLDLTSQKVAIFCNEDSSLSVPPRRLSASLLPLPSHQAKPAPIHTFYSRVARGTSQHYMRALPVPPAGAPFV